MRPVTREEGRLVWEREGSSNPPRALRHRGAPAQGSTQVGSRARGDEAPSRHTSNKRWDALSSSSSSAISASQSGSSIASDSSRVEGMGLPGHCTANTWRHVRHGANSTVPASKAARDISRLLSHERRSSLSLDIDLVGSEKLPCPSARARVWHIDRSCAVRSRWRRRASCHAVAKGRGEAVLDGCGGCGGVRERCGEGGWESSVPVAQDGGPDRVGNG